MDSGNLFAFGLMALFIGAAAIAIIHESHKKKRANQQKSELMKSLADSVTATGTPDPKICLKLGDICWDQGDQNEAIEHFKCAADLKSTEACTRLSNIYFSKAELEHYFEYELKAAELGKEVSMRNVSNSYKSGQGVLKNIGKSTYWLLRSAESGNMNSMTSVAERYITGFGVQENPMEGLAWLYVAEHKRSYEAAGMIKNAEAKLNNSLILHAQDRAKVLLDLIKDGHRTSEASFGNTPGAATPGQPTGPKPKHSAKGSGSGAVISPAGHIATAAHVIKGATYLEIVTPEGTFPATVLNNDEQNDVALLKVDRAFGTHIRVGRSSEVRLGQSVATIGFPNIGIQGHSPKVTQGMISSENGIQNDIRMWQISVPIQPGNSGGPLLDEKGRLVGIVVATLSLRAIQMTGSVPQNVNYAIKGAYLEPLLNFHKLSAEDSTGTPPESFQDMIATAQKSSVLILVY
jgi:S1-C subfamily serine protease